MEQEGDVCRFLNKLNEKYIRIIPTVSSPPATKAQTLLYLHQPELYLEVDARPTLTPFCSSTEKPQMKVLEIRRCSLVDINERWKGI